MSGNDAIKSLIQKLLVVGLFFFFIQQWQTVTTTTLQSFARGRRVGRWRQPDGIERSVGDRRQQGLNAIQPLSDKVDALTQGTWTALKNLGTIMQLGLAMIGILFSFFLLGIQCFLVYVEFYIVAILSLILLPFGVFRHTAFLAEKAFGAVLAHGIKLMVLAFVIAIAQPVLQQITLPADFWLRDAWCTLLAAMAICFLAWHAPGMAAGLLAGSPTLSAGQAFGGALEAGGAVALGAAGIAAAGRAAASGVGATVQAASAIKTGASVGASRAAEAGAGSLGQTAGAVGGAAKVAMSPLARIGERMRERVANGELAGLAAHGLDPPPANKPASDSSTASSSTATSGFRAADGGGVSPPHDAPSSAAFSSASSAAPSAGNTSSPATRQSSSPSPDTSYASATPQTGASTEAWRGLRRVAESSAQESAPRSTPSSDTLDAARIAPGQRRVDDEASAADDFSSTKE